MPLNESPLNELFTRSDVRRWRQSTEGMVGLVPTMGSLHAGHIRLMAIARQECDVLIASVFVNPLQFGPDEDFDNYPRDYQRDRDQLAAAGVDAMFAPTVETMYPRGLSAASVVDVPGLTETLCGAHRPGHFQGVATVVAKLFNLSRPDLAYFGEKDYQQLAIIDRMADDLAMDVDVRGLPIQRESSGLARSSRNAYLDADQRRHALALHAALCEAAEKLASGSRDFTAIEHAGRDSMTAVGFKVDYFEIRATNLDPPGTDEQNFRVLAAGWLGSARLIDNVAAQSEQT